MQHLMLGQTAVIYTHTYTHIQHFHLRTVLGKQPRETHTLTEVIKARQKRRLGGSTTGFVPKKVTCIEEKQRLRQTAVVYCNSEKQTNKNKETYTHTHKYMFVYIHIHTSVCLYV